MTMDGHIFAVGADSPSPGSQHSLPRTIKRKPLPSSAKAVYNPVEKQDGQADPTEWGYEDLSRWGKTTKLFSGVDTWIWEIASAILSVASIVALIIILRHIQDQPQSSWTFRFTPNTVISLLATTAQTSLLFTVSAVIGQEKWRWFGLGRSRGFRQDTRLIDLQIFDDASRGPLGSIHLLWLTQMKRLAAVGASLTLLSLAIGPVSQQVLDVKFHSAEINNLTIKTDVQRSERYDAFTPFLGTMEADAPKGNDLRNMYPTLGMRAAIINGLMTSPIENITLSCQSGNCQWPIFPTLGVCSECVDVTSLLNHTLEQPSSGDTLESWSLPNGLQSLNDTYMVIGSTWYAHANHFQDPYTPYLSIFDVITTPNKVISVGQAEALECAVWFCLKAYNISTVDGKQSENVTSTWSSYVEVIIPNALNATTAETTTAKRDVVTWYPVNHIFKTPPAADFNTVSDANYSVSHSSLQAIATLLNATFSGNPSDNSSSEGIQVLVPTRGKLQTVQNLMSNLALSMTNHMRLNPALGNENGIAIDPWHRIEYVAKAWATQSYFTVRWLWITLPVVVVVTSCIHLYIVAFQSWTSKANIWKGSSLPMMFFPIADGIRNQFSIHSTTYDMQKVAESLRGSFA